MPGPSCGAEQAQLLGGELRDGKILEIIHFPQEQNYKLSPPFLLCKHKGNLLSSSYCSLSTRIIPLPQKDSQLLLSEQEQIKDFSIFASPHLRIFLHLLFRDKSLPLKNHLAKWFSQPQGMVQEGLQSRIQSSWWGCRNSRRSGDECVHIGPRITFYMPCSYIYFQLAVWETHTPTSVAMPITIKLFPLQDSVLPSVFLSPSAVHRLLTLDDMN